MHTEVEHTYMFSCNYLDHRRRLWLEFKHPEIRLVLAKIQGSIVTKPVHQLTLKTKSQQVIELERTRVAITQCFGMGVADV